jgi:two-component system alkaline phosphatase synthesis response regulator PhoP
MNHRQNNPGSSKGHILVVEDDDALREGLRLNLELHDYTVSVAADGDAGMALAFDANPDLIILDLALPGWSGLDILKELRNRGEELSVLILSARTTTDQKVEGLSLGADDYISKPFDLPELLARIEARLRRERETHSLLITDGELTIEPATHEVTIAGESIELSAKEFDLLCLLATSPERIFSRDTILEKVWGWDYEGTARTVDNFVANIRKKLGRRTLGKHYIRTVPRVGYRFGG